MTLRTSAVAVCCSSGCRNSLRSRVLDGAHGLSGDGGHQIDLLLAEWVHLLAGQRKDTYCRSFSQKRYAEYGPKPECPPITDGGVLGAASTSGLWTAFPSRATRPTALWWPARAAGDRVRTASR